MPAISIDHVQVAIPKGGEGVAREFYAQLLGLSEIPKPGSLAGRGGLWLQAANIQFHLGVDPDFRPATKAHVGFSVENLSEVLRLLENAGYDIQHDESVVGLTRAFTSDPFGNRVELLEPGTAP
jgi:catechol 2,3-dioxygenase-like lactoylglutathione lyase family enzyme